VTGEGSAPTCAERGATADADADGWRAYIAFLEEHGEPPEVVVYRPTSVELEFDALG
jgi:hypothetical protein